MRHPLRLGSFLLACLCMAFLAVPASAQSAYQSAVAGFAADSYLDTDKAIGAVAATGDPLALPALQALQDGRLLFTTDPAAVFIRGADGALMDAVTGKPVDAAPAGLKPVRMNNRVRGTLAASLGTLTLLSSDPARRLSAAHEVFRSRDPAALPALATALGREQNPDVKAALADAQAAILATTADTPEAQRLAAIETLRARSGQEALTLLTSVASSSDGAVKAAAQAGVSSIQTRLTIWSNVQNVWYGMSLGSVLLLAAIGLAITFGVMGVINMAHGEMVMLGAYTTFVVQEVIREYAPALFDMSLFIAVPLAFLVTGAAGVVVERTIIRFLYGRPLETLLATFGLSLILQQLVRSLFGADNRDVGAPAFMSGTFNFGGLAITYGRMWIIVFALMVFAAIQLLLRMTSFGLKMRAVTQNRRMASAMGVDTNRVDALAFGLGSGIAGIAGVALSQIDNVSPNLGQGYIIDSFMVVVFGGVGNLWGTLVAALTLGIANKFLEPIAGAVLGKIALLVFIILFIQKRPRGLFALKGRAVEA
jgi:urea transport system permease protein